MRIGQYRDYWDDDPDPVDERVQWAEQTSVDDPEEARRVDRENAQVEREEQLKGE